MFQKIKKIIGKMATNCLLDIDFVKDIPLRKFKFLLACGADINALKNEKSLLIVDQSPLIRSIARNNLHNVEILVEHGAIIDCTKGDGENPLFFAADLKDTKIAEFLLQHGADKDLNKKNKNKITLFMNLVRSTCNVDFINLLLDYGADIKASTHENGGRMALELVCCYGSARLNVIDCLINRGADVNAQSLLHGSLLMKAVADRDVELAQNLIDKGADIMAESIGDKQTVLHTACEYGTVEQVESFIEKGLSVNHQDAFGQTPLFKAVMRDDMDITNVLIEHGADVNVKDAEGDVPLMHVESIHMAKFLFENGADVSKMNLAFFAENNPHKGELLGFLYNVDKDVIHIASHAHPVTDAKEKVNS